MILATTARLHIFRPPQLNRVALTVMAASGPIIHRSLVTSRRLRYARSVIGRVSTNPSIRMQSICFLLAPARPLISSTNGPRDVDSNGGRPDSLMSAVKLNPKAFTGKCGICSEPDMNELILTFPRVTGLWTLSITSAPLSTRGRSQPFRESAIYARHSLGTPRRGMYPSLCEIERVGRKPWLFSTSHIGHCNSDADLDEIRISISQSAGAA